MTGSIAVLPVQTPSWLGLTEFWPKRILTGDRTVSPTSRTDRFDPIFKTMLLITPTFFVSYSCFVCILYTWDIKLIVNVVGVPSKLVGSLYFSFIYFFPLLNSQSKRNLKKLCLFISFMVRKGTHFVFNKIRSYQRILQMEGRSKSIIFWRD